MEQGYQENYYANWNDPWAKSKGNWLQPNRSELYQHQHPQQHQHQQNTHLHDGYYDSYYPPNNVSG